MFEIFKDIIDMFFIYFNAMYNIQVELYKGVYVKVGHICIGVILIIILLSYVINAIGGGDSE